MFDNKLTKLYTIMEDGEGGLKMISDKLKAVQIAAGLKLENMPEEFGSVSNISKKINSNRCSVDFLVAFLKACGCRLVIESEDGTRTPVNPEDVPPLVLGKRRVGTGRPRKGK